MDLIRYESRVMLFQLSSSIHSSSVFSLDKENQFFSLVKACCMSLWDHRIFNRHGTILSWEINHEYAKDILGIMRKCAVIDMRNLICNFNLSFEGQDIDNFSYCQCTQGLLISTFGNEMRYRLMINVQHYSFIAYWFFFGTNIALSLQCG